jgi:hypothetical protein
MTEIRMTMPARGWLFVTAMAVNAAAAVPVDLSAVKSGPVTVTQSATAVTVTWPDENNRPWTAEFSLDPKGPLISFIGLGPKHVITGARPFYQGQAGKRRGGFDQFFDFPPSHPEGTRAFDGVFELNAVRAKSLGDRVELSFDGFKLGIFQGTLRYEFFPGSRLIEQAAVVATNEPDTAYIYSSALRMTVDANRRPGGNMETRVSFYDPTGVLKTVLSDGPDKHPERVRFRTIATPTGGGSVAVFPAPHRFFFPRDFTTNLGYVWHDTWRGVVSLGIRQLPDDDWIYYPWFNAPPGTEQRLSMFLMVSDREPRAALEDVLRYTNRDKYPVVPGFQTVTSHWHFAYTVQAIEKGFAWTPPFKTVLESLGVQAAMIDDFHGDGHPHDTGKVRLDEVEAFYKAARVQSTGKFLLIPAEEANTHFGGHWAITFPKPVYWIMSRKEGEPFAAPDSKFGTVYRVGNVGEMLDLVRRENGFAYQTHPRTKGSTGFPDKTRDEEYFRDPHYFGAGWKAMNADLSSPRLGDRSFKTLDDMNNWGPHKRLIGENDVFQVDSTHELYSHMNINYVKMPQLPAFDDYGRLLDTIRAGQFFVSTGEVLLPESSIAGETGDQLKVALKVQHTFPLAMAEVVWGDGRETHRKEFPLQETRQFATDQFSWKVDAKGWKWARVAVWDIATNGAFINPVWKSE